MADLRPAHREPDAARRGPHRDGVLRRHAVHGRSHGSTGRWMARWIRRPAARPAPASDTGRTGTRPPRVRPYLRLGSWIGGDRDGNPGVTAEITEKTLRIHADHVLRGYEAVATRLMQTIAAATSGEPVDRALASRLARDAEDLPETDRQLRRRFPDEPYRQRFGFIAERLRRTRAALVGEPAPLTGRYGVAGRARRGARRDRRRARRGWPRPRRVGRGRGVPLAARARSASTSRRSRSASTRRSTRRRWPRSGRARRAPRSSRRA